jgi:hypothetical protein
MGGDNSWLLHAPEPLPDPLCTLNAARALKGALTLTRKKSLQTEVLLISTGSMTCHQFESVSTNSEQLHVNLMSVPYTERVCLRFNCSVFQIRQLGIIEYHFSYNVFDEHGF